MASVDRVGENKVRVTELKDFFFCKAVPWIKRKLNWKEPLTVSQKLGKKADLREVTKDLVEPKYYELYLRDKKTGLCGVVDVISGETVVEVKAFQRRYNSDSRIQLLGYAYLADRNGFKVREAMLIMDNKVRLKIEVTKEHINYIEEIVNKLVEVLEDDSPPVVNQSSRQCKACQYRRVCPVSSDVV